MPPPDPSPDASGDEILSLDVQYGRQVTLPVAQYFDPSGRWYTNSVGPPVDLVWAQWAEPKQATVILRMQGAPVTPATQVYATLSIALGSNARFSRTVPIQPGPSTAIRVFGRGIHVSAFMVAPAGGTVGQVVSGAISEGDLNPLGELVPVWNNPASGALGSPIVIGNTPQPLTAPGALGGGYLLGLSGFVRPSVPGTVGVPYFLQVYDVAIDSGVAYRTAVAAGLGPLFTLGPFIGAQPPTAFSFDRSLRPSLRYVNGLAVAISGNDQSYVSAVGAGNLEQQAILSWDLGL